MTRQLLLPIFLVLTAVTVVRAESAFAPLGIGIWQRSGNTWTNSVSGANLAVADSVYFTLGNPASWYSLGLTRFTTSFSASKIYGHDATGGDIADTFMFPNAAITIPFYHSLGLGFLFQSLTDHDYLVYNDETYDIQEPVDTLESYDILRRVQGNGGMSRASAGFALRLSPGFSAGAGVDYYFGALEELVTLDFEQGSFSRSGRYIRHELAGVGASAGILYQSSGGFGFGLAARLPARLDVTSTMTVEGGDSGGVDTGPIELPLALKAGAGFESGRLRSMIAVGDESWKSGDHSFAGNFTYVNALSAGLGFERLPRREPLLPWYEVWTFRGGLNWRQNYIEARGKILNIYGASLGLGIPIAGGSGMLDAAFTYELRGSVVDNGAREQIYGLQLGISSSERWFVRRKR